MQDYDKLSAEWKKVSEYVTGGASAARLEPEDTWATMMLW